MAEDRQGIQSRGLQHRLRPIVRQLTASRTGFSFIQLLTAIALLAILVAVALPGLRNAINLVRAEQMKTHLLAAFASARATAISRQQDVTICASSDGFGCGQDWGVGWLIFLDPDRTGEPSGPEAILRHHAGRRQGHLQVRSSSGRPALRYASNGRSFGTNLTISLCVGGMLHSEIIVNNSGRVRSQVHRHRPACL